MYVKVTEFNIAVKCVWMLEVGVTYQHMYLIQWSPYLMKLWDNGFSYSYAKLRKELFAL